MKSFLSIIFCLMVYLCPNSYAESLGQESNNNSNSADKAEPNSHDFSLYLRGSYDFPGAFGTISNTDWGGTDAKDGYSISGELIASTPKSKHVKLGLGMGYQFPRDRIAGIDRGKFTFFQYYMTCYLLPFISNSTDNNLFFQLEIGRNYHGGDAKYQSLYNPISGTHYGIGTGITIENRLIAEWKLTNDTGKLKDKNNLRNVADIYYMTYTISLGIILW